MCINQHSGVDERKFLSQANRAGTWIKDENDRISEGGVDEDQVTVGVPLIV